MGFEPVDDKEFIDSWTQMQKSVHATAVEKGFWDKALNDGEKIALMHSELSEALEALRKNAQDDKIPAFSGLEAELADLIIRVMDYAEAKQLRIPEAMLAKAAFNKTRPYKHGKAF
jgi:NTP pyrophosphatase (non-canonical NTP hydrolase)